MTKHFHELKHFIVRLALFGVKKENDPNAVADFEEELRMRPHIREFRVTWENKSQPVDFEVVVEGVTEDDASKDIAEELWEVAAGLLNDVEGMHVEVKQVFLKR